MIRRQLYTPQIPFTEADKVSQYDRDFNAGVFRDLDNSLDKSLHLRDLPSPKTGRATLVHNVDAATDYTMDGGAHATTYDTRGTFTVPAGKQLSVNSVRPTVTLAGSGGSPAVFMPYGFDFHVYTTIATDEANGFLGAIRLHGPGVGKNGYFRTDMQPGATGVGMGAVSAVTSVATANTAATHQFDWSGTIGGQGFVLWLTSNSGGTAGHGLVNSGNLGFSQAFAQWNHKNASESAWFFRQYDDLGNLVHGVDSNGLMTHAKSLTLTGHGYPLILAKDHKTAQSAALATVTLLASAPATGWYEVGVYCAVTTAATTSSTLGPIQITATDPDDSVAKTTRSTNTTTDTANSTSVSIPFCMPIYVKAGSSIAYSIGYATSGATAMQYNVAAICKWLA